MEPLFLGNTPEAFRSKWRWYTHLILKGFSALSLSSWMKSGKLINFSVLNFLICKTETLIIPYSSGTLRVNKHVYKIYDLVPDTIHEQS